MVNFPLSNHHFQNSHLTNLTFIDVYEIPMYLNEIWDENVKISFLNDLLPRIWIILMNRIPVRLTLALVLQLTHFALASLNYVIFVIITQYLITERLNSTLVIGSERGWAWVVSDFGRDYGELFDKLKILTTLDNTQQSNV